MQDIDFGDWVLKEKELILGVGIFSVLMIFGFFIGSKIEDYCSEQNLVYQQAAFVSDTEEFSHLMNTDGGNAFVEGSFNGMCSFSHPKVGGQHLYLKAEYQTEHEDTYTYTDEDGNTHEETTYYWKTDRTEEHCTPSVKFCGVVFPISKFNLGRCHEKHYVRTGSRKRIVFDVIPYKMNGAVFSDLKNNTIENRTEFFRGYNNDSLREHLISFASYYAFWTVWIFLSIALVLVFFLAENKWLDTKNS